MDSNNKVLAQTGKEISAVVVTSAATSVLLPKVALSVLGFFGSGSPNTVLVRCG
jgi:hypothetical protein